MNDRTHDRTDADTDQYGTHLAARLTALADAPAPASRLDTAWAIRTGRSRLRRRRAGALVAVAAAVLGISLVGTVLPFGNPGIPATSIPDGPPALPRYGPDTGRDPMAASAAFGWLPKGFDQLTYHSHPTKGRMGIKAFGPAIDEVRRPAVFLDVYAPGEQPPVVQSREPRATASVNGKPMYWLDPRPGTPAADGGQRILRFHAPDGRWAELTTIYMDSFPVEELLPRIAKGVRAGQQAAALPFTVENVPADYEPYGADFNLGLEAASGLPWTASLTYKLGQNYISVVARPDVERDPPFTPDQGAEAPPGLCKSQRGLRLCVHSPQGEEPFAAAGGLQGWLDRVTGLGTDPADWTTDVIR
ncbi:hypothetical protein ACFVFS_07685 [Kitasatospora sp. NPDC057692]|uniref:hypothetical protein n=1 Tax=Kitasatospora sp. NPDC057692 TaxID=3346215 RepID=UPI0036A7DC96